MKNARERVLIIRFQRLEANESLVMPAAIMLLRINIGISVITILMPLLPPRDKYDVSSVLHILKVCGINDTNITNTPETAPIPLFFFPKIMRSISSESFHIS